MARNQTPAIERLEIETRRLQVLELLDKGYKTYRIAAKLGVSQMTVQRDMKEVRKRRIMLAMVLDDQRVERRIDELREIQREAWEEYQHSGEPESHLEYEPDEKGILHLSKKHVRRKVKTPAFLAIIRNCSRDISELEGLIGKDKFESAATDQTPKFLRVVVESRQQVEQYESLRLDQLRASGIIEGSAQSPAENPE